MESCGEGDHWDQVSTSHKTRGRCELCEPPCADFVAGTALCEPPCADFVAGTACEPPCADFVAGTALCEPPCAEFVAGTALCEPRCADFVAGTASAELEDENWRVCSTTLVRGAMCGARS